MATASAKDGSEPQSIGLDSTGNDLPANDALVVGHASAHHHASSLSMSSSSQSVGIAHRQMLSRFATPTPTPPSTTTTITMTALNNAAGQAVGYTQHQQHQLQHPQSPPKVIVGSRSQQHVPVPIPAGASDDGQGGGHRTAGASPSVQKPTPQALFPLAHHQGSHHPPHIHHAGTNVGLAPFVPYHPPHLPPHLYQQITPMTIQMMQRHYYQQLQQQNRLSINSIVGPTSAATGIPSSSSSSSPDSETILRSAATQAASTMGSESSSSASMTSFSPSMAARTIMTPSPTPPPFMHQQHALYHRQQQQQHYHHHHHNPHHHHFRPPSRASSVSTTAPTTPSPEPRTATPPTATMKTNETIATAIPAAGGDNRRKKMTKKSKVAGTATEITAASSTSSTAADAVTNRMYDEIWKSARNEVMDTLKQYQAQRQKKKKNQQQKNQQQQQGNNDDANENGDKKEARTNTSGDRDGDDDETNNTILTTLIPTINMFDADILRGITMRPSGRWQGQLYYQGKSRYIGVFNTREEAAIAYELMRRKVKPSEGSGSAAAMTDNGLVTSISTSPNGDAPSTSSYPSSDTGSQFQPIIRTMHSIDVRWESIKSQAHAAVKRQKQNECSSPVEEASKKAGVKTGVRLPKRDDYPSISLLPSHKWKAEIQYGDKMCCIGSFETYDDAVVAYEHVRKNLSLPSPSAVAASDIESRCKLSSAARTTTAHCIHSTVSRDTDAPSMMEQNSSGKTVGETQQPLGVNALLMVAKNNDVLKKRSDYGLRLLEMVIKTEMGETLSPQSAATPHPMEACSKGLDFTSNSNSSKKRKFETAITPSSRIDQEQWDAVKREAIKYVAEEGQKFTSTNVGKYEEESSSKEQTPRGIVRRDSGRWQAQLYWKGKMRYIGVFRTKELAAMAHEFVRERLRRSK